MPVTADQHTAAGDLRRTPAGRRLQWLLDAVRDPLALARAGAEESAAQMAPALLATVTPGQLLGSLLQVADSLGVPSVDRLDLSEPYDAAARLVAADGRMWTLRCLVDQEPPHGILHTQLTPARVASESGCSAPTPWRELADDAPVGSTTLDPAVAAALDATVGRLREELRLPGLAVAVAVGEETAYWRAVGYAEVATRRRPGRRTAVRAAGVSAVTTTLAVLHAASSRGIDLAAPVNDHLRAFGVEPPAGAPPVRILDVLTHTSGVLPQPATVTGVRAGLAAPTPAELYAPAIAAELPRDTRVVPADENLAVAGQLVEDVTGVTFAEYAATHVLDPLGMRHSSYTLDDRVARQPMCGYDVEFDEVLVAAGTDVVLTAAAGLASTVDDLLVLGRALSSPQRLAAVCGQAAPGLLTTPYAATSVAGVAASAGMFCAELAGEPVCWRAGGWPGAMTELWVAPEASVSLVVAANAFTPARLGALDGAAAQLMSTILESRAGAR